MLTDIPYSTLAQDSAYEIMLLRDQENAAFAEIARRTGRSAGGAAQLYNRVKVKQIRLYLNHIACWLGHETAAEVTKFYYSIYECYQDRRCACAYLEKSWQELLDRYRCGEPGMPKSFAESLPPLLPPLGEKTVARIVSLRESGTSFQKIAQELNLTPVKAKHVYNSHYHKLVLGYLESLPAEGDGAGERRALWESYLNKNVSPKKFYDEMRR